jgi:transcriptional regulator with XRE-family HTH domain
MEPRRKNAAEKAIADKVAVAFGDRVRHYRKQLPHRAGEREVSQERLAELCDMHRTYIGHVERGEVNVALHNIVRIAKALKVDPAVLVEGLTP